MKIYFYAHEKIKVSRWLWWALVLNWIIDGILAAIDLFLRFT